MKKKALALIATFFVLIGMAQESQWKPIARGQSDKGQWVVERHKEATENLLVSFYTMNNTLMYKEEVKSSKVNPVKERTVRRLEQLLNKIAVEWEASKMVAGRQLVQDSFN